MLVYTGLKPPLDYSVYSASACALLLALHDDRSVPSHHRRWSAVMTRRPSGNRRMTLSHAADPCVWVDMNQTDQHLDLIQRLFEAIERRDRRAVRRLPSSRLRVHLAAFAAVRRHGCRVGAGTWLVGNLGTAAANRGRTGDVAADRGGCKERARGALAPARQERRRRHHRHAGAVVLHASRMGVSSTQRCSISTCQRSICSWICPPGGMVEMAVLASLWTVCLRGDPSGLGVRVVRRARSGGGSHGVRSTVVPGLRRHRRSRVLPRSRCIQCTGGEPRREGSIRGTRGQRCSGLRRGAASGRRTWRDCVARVGPRRRVRLRVGPVVRAWRRPVCRSPSNAARIFASYAGNGPRFMTCSFSSPQNQD